MIVKVLGRVAYELAFDAMRDFTAARSDDTGDEVAGPRVLGAAEAQRVEDRDRPRAHREYVAQDAADPGCRPLIGFDE